MLRQVKFIAPTAICLWNTVLFVNKFNIKKITLYSYEGSNFTKKKNNSYNNNK